MIEIDQIIRQVSKNTNIDLETVDTVCKHVFESTVAVMKDNEDYRDVLFNGLFKFKLKTRFKNNKTKQYSAR